MRKLPLADVGPVIFADTVGFISHLPHKLVQAFRATLEEAANATLLLHVVDGHSEERQNNIQQVREVLEEIGAGDLPVLMVFNKIDLLEGVEPHIERDVRGKPVAVWVSARTGAGRELLLQALSELLVEDIFHETLALPVAAARLRALLYRENAVVAEAHADNGDFVIETRLPRLILKRALKSVGMTFEQLSILTMDDILSCPDATEAGALRRSEKIA
jgi:GTPase